MSKKNTPDYAPPMEASANMASKQPKKKKKGSGIVGRIIRRFFLLLFTIVILVVAALCLAANLVFNGPSPAARSVLTMTLLEPSATKWIPALFIGEDGVDAIRNSAEGTGLTEEISNTSQVVIKKTDAITSEDHEWDNYPDGIRIDHVSGDTYNAHIMIIRDPSRVYMGTSTDGNFSTSIPGKRINKAIEDEGAAAAINAGAFNDDGTASSYVGSIPAGLVMSQGVMRSDTGYGYLQEKGFAGFNEDDILVVAKSMTQEQAKEQKIRDGCCFGPVLIMNGEVNMEAYAVSGWNPRTAIGQRADGAVIFVCIDGRQAGSIGGTYADVINIMVEYGAVNACNMDGGSSSVMMYHDIYGLYGEAGQYQMINNYSLLQSEPRRMPNFWMVRPAG